MAVDPAWQGIGVASALLRAAEAALAERGCVRVTLDTTQVLSRAKRFYERNGYRLSGSVTDFFGMPLYEFFKHLTWNRSRCGVP
jgi:GNAT superfamily N-acetyltransferase